MTNNPLADALRRDGVPEAFRADGRLRLAHALPEDRARAFAGHLSGLPDWQLTMSVGGRNARIAPQTFESYPPEERQQLFQNLSADAARGQGFFYDSIELTGGESGLLAEAAAMIRAPETLAAVSAMLGEDVTSVSAQATRYRPGQWLTRHRDDPQGETRRLAYVLSLTERWHPDWGGLLQFFEDDGMPRDAWMPGLGALALFRVSHVHSVTYVAPWAQAPRLAITGWFSA